VPGATGRRPALGDLLDERRLVLDHRPLLLRVDLLALLDELHRQPRQLAGLGRLAAGPRELLALDGLHLLVERLELLALGLDAPAALGQRGLLLGQPRLVGLDHDGHRLVVLARRPLLLAAGEQHGGGAGGGSEQDLKLGATDLGCHGRLLATPQASRPTIS
jgi:hypothetical protein